MNILSFKVIATGYEVTVMIDGDKRSFKTYWDYDCQDKVNIDGAIYELIGLSELRRIQ